MEFEPARRDFLQIAGTGATVSLAGCSGLQRSDQPTDRSESNGDTVVSIAVRASEKKLQQVQSNLKSELSAGNITRREAQKRYRDAQIRLREKAVVSFEKRVSGQAALTIEDSVAKLGILLGSGSPDALIQALSAPEVAALLPKAKFQLAKSRANQTDETPSN